MRKVTSSSVVDTCVASDQCGSSPHCSLLKSITQTRCRQLAACGGVKQALTRAHTRTSEKLRKSLTCSSTHVVLLAEKKRNEFVFSQNIISKNRVYQRLPRAWPVSLQSIPADTRVTARSGFRLRSVKEPLRDVGEPHRRHRPRNVRVFFLR